MAGHILGRFLGTQFWEIPPFFRNDTTLGTFFRKCWGFTNCLALIQGQICMIFWTPELDCGILKGGDPKSSLKFQKKNPYRIPSSPLQPLQHPLPPFSKFQKNLTVQKNVHPKIQGQAIHFVGGDFLEHLFEIRSHVNSLTIPDNFTRIAQAQFIFDRDCIWSSHLQYGILIMGLSQPVTARVDELHFLRWYVRHGSLPSTAAKPTALASHRQRSPAIFLLSCRSQKMVQEIPRHWSKSMDTWRILKDLKLQYHMSQGRSSPPHIGDAHPTRKKGSPSNRI